MKMSVKVNTAGRAFLSLIAFTLVAWSVMNQPAAAQSGPNPSARSLKIGIIGSGRMGGSLGEFWAKAGHEVFFSSRHPEQLQDLVKRVGPRARAGTPREAAVFGEVILISVPYAALPEIGRRLGMSPHTVRHHAEWVFAKVGVHTRKALGLKLLDSGPP